MGKTRENGWRRF